MQIWIPTLLLISKLYDLSKTLISTALSFLICGNRVTVVTGIKAGKKHKWIRCDAPLAACLHSWQVAGSVHQHYHHYVWKSLDARGGVVAATQATGVWSCRGTDESVPTPICTPDFWVPSACFGCGAQPIFGCLVAYCRANMGSNCFAPAWAPLQQTKHEVLVPKVP